MKQDIIRNKRRGAGLEMRTFPGKDSRSYLVFRTPRGAYHGFKETEAKQAARVCGTTVEGNTRKMWGALWDKKPFGS